MSSIRPKSKKDYLHPKLPHCVQNELFHLLRFLLEITTLWSQVIVQPLHVSFDKFFYRSKWLGLVSEGRVQLITLQVGCIVINFPLNFFVRLANFLKELTSLLIFHKLSHFFGLLIDILQILFKFSNFLFQLDFFNIRLFNKLNQFMFPLSQLLHFILILLAKLDNKSLFSFKRPQFLFQNSPLLHQINQIFSYFLLLHIVILRSHNKSTITRF